MAAPKYYGTGVQTLTALTGGELITVDTGGPQLTVISAQNLARGVGGSVTLNGATAVSVTNAAVTANSVVTFGLKTVGGTVGAYPTVKTITPGTGFTVAGTAADTSIYNYSIEG